MEECKDVQTKQDRMRALRKRKILDNAKNRMDKLRSVQQRSTTAVPPVKNTRASGGDERSGKYPDPEKSSEKDEPKEPLVAEDPPDEIIAPPSQEAFLSSSLPPLPPVHVPPPSSVVVWVAMLQANIRPRGILSVLSGVLVALTTIIMGYDIRCFLCLLTSELCLLLWTFVSALTNRSPPPAANAPEGMFGVLKLAVGLVSPAASRAMGQALLVLAVCNVLLQDLCVSLFFFVATTAVCLLLHP